MTTPTPQAHEGEGRVKLRTINLVHFDTEEDSDGLWLRLRFGDFMPDDCVYRLRFTGGNIAELREVLDDYEAALASRGKGGDG